MIDLGTVQPGSTITIPWSSFSGTDSSQVTVTNYAAADLLVYKDGGTTERASTSGFTATTDFDSKTGKQIARIDLSDNTTAGFWAAGSEYIVAVDAVTIDGTSTGDWIARFKIGYNDATLNTTLSSVTNQTTIVLAAGPAEDDAINGRWAVIHDVASAVQCSWVQVLDYVGSTRTVTLAAAPTFTVAASDNFSLLGPMPVQATVLGRTLDITATGAAGIDLANVENQSTTLALSGTTILSASAIETDTQDIQGRIPSALVGGRMDANMGAISSDATAADNAESFFDGTGYAGTNNVIPTVTALTGHTPQTGDAYARIGATGSGLTSLASQSSVTAIPASILTTALTESYAADGAAGTLTQILYGIQQMLQEKSISSTTMTVRRLDGSTTAMTFTLNDATTPTSITRAS